LPRFARIGRFWQPDMNAFENLEPAALLFGLYLDFFLRAWYNKLAMTLGVVCNKSAISTLVIPARLSWLAFSACVDPFIVCTSKTDSIRSVRSFLSFTAYLLRDRRFAVNTLTAPGEVLRTSAMVRLSSPASLRRRALSVVLFSAPT
jgi:hypothetical protein